MTLDDVDLFCPDCGSPEVVDAGRRGADRFGCRNCGGAFGRHTIRVRLGDVAHLAREICTCDDRRGCPRCFARAEAMVGARVRDDRGRDFVVRAAGEKDGHPTISGDDFWASPDEVEVIEPAGRAQAPSS